MISGTFLQKIGTSPQDTSPRESHNLRQTDDRRHEPGCVRKSNKAIGNSLQQTKFEKVIEINDTSHTSMFEFKRDRG